MTFPTPLMTRRQALKTSALALTAALLPSTGKPQSIIDGRFQPLYSLPSLPYPLEALEPCLDARTVEDHHGKCHATYVAKLNQTLAQIPSYYFTTKQAGNPDAALSQMLKDLNSVPEQLRNSIRNNGGGHYNHSLLWLTMGKPGGAGPSGALAIAINQTFGSFSAFKEALTAAALSHFGSGWAWLSLDHSSLRLETTANEDNPVEQGRQVILGLDLWEHAYYLKYQNRRADYIAAWFNIVNWDFVAERYANLRG